MPTADDPTTVGGDTATSIPDGLLRLRADAGMPSFGLIASRVSQRRSDRSGRTIVVARSTVYDVFRADRKRFDADLVSDIVLALGGDEGDAVYWRRRCAADAATARAASVAGPVSPPPPGAPAATASRSSRALLRRRPGTIAALLTGAVAINVVGAHAVRWLDLPLYLDMIGTAAIAIVLGPWYAVATAIATQFGAAALHADASGLPYTVIGIVGALIWGYGVQAWGLGRTAGRFFALTLMVAVACSIVAAPITAMVFGGVSVHEVSDTLTSRLLAAGEWLGAAIFSANLITSVLDKLIAGFIGLAIGGSLSHRLARRSPDFPSSRVLLRVSRRPRRPAPVVAWGSPAAP